MPEASKDTKKILVVDDEKDVADLLEYNLKANGYLVEAIYDPLQIMSKIMQFQPDLLLLDIMMPELDGTKICRMLRAGDVSAHIPIIFVSARGEIEDKIEGLEIGADDYICKPFDMRELLLRVKAILKRGSQISTESSNLIRLGDMEIDTDAYTVKIFDETIDLTTTEFRLLKLLMSTRGQIHSRDDLLNSVWKYQSSDIETRTVDTHIRRLREKLGANGKVIETVRGVGYKIAAD